jgi:hypothetical protein
VAEPGARKDSRCRTWARAAVAVGVASLALGTAGSRAAPGGGVERVTLIGDSVATAFNHNADARRILGRGIELKLEVAPCRRIAPDSCPYEGERALTVLELVRLRGASLGPTVIVAVGYNDFESQYADNIEAALDELDKAGVRRVLWPTLRAARHPHLPMNAAIEAAAERHPEMKVVDWNVYSRSHPDWFQDDGIHLTPAGVVSMAMLLNRTLVEVKVALPPLEIVTSSLRGARKGASYSARLLARGGKTPYRWSFTGLPVGIHASSTGLLTGKPRVRPGVYTAVASVADALGEAASRRLVLRVRR